MPEVRKAFALIGAGLRCEHLSWVAEKLKEYNEIWVDVYTSPHPGGLAECVKKFVGTEPKVATRDVLEGEFKFGSSVAIVVPGDPLAATAHAALLLEAKKKGYEVEIIPNVSALQVARTKSGLSQYRFGRTVTLMYPREGIKFTESVYYAIKDNDSLNLHTIVLLETGYDKTMTVPEAAKLLCEYEELCEREAIAMARLCWDDEKIVLAKVRELAEEDMGEGPQLLVFPSPKLHPIEEELVRLLWGTKA